MCYDRKNKFRFLPKRTRTRTAEVVIEGGISDDENPRCYNAVIATTQRKLLRKECTVHL